MKIYITERNEKVGEHVHFNRFRVFRENGEYSGEGRTREEALGRFLLSSLKELDVEVEDRGPDPQ